jgi:hypothetical protein
MKRLCYDIYNSSSISYDTSIKLPYAPLDIYSTEVDINIKDYPSIIPYSKLDGLRLYESTGILCSFEYYVRTGRFISALRSHVSLIEVPNPPVYDKHELKDRVSFKTEFFTKRFSKESEINEAIYVFVDTILKSDKFINLEREKLIVDFISNINPNVSITIKNEDDNSPCYDLGSLALMNETLIPEEPDWATNYKNHDGSIISGSDYNDAYCLPKEDDKYQKLVENLLEDQEADDQDDSEISDNENLCSLHWDPHWTIDADLYTDQNSERCSICNYFFQYKVLLYRDKDDPFYYNDLDIIYEKIVLESNTDVNREYFPS